MDKEVYLPPYSGPPMNSGATPSHPGTNSHPGLHPDAPPRPGFHRGPRPHPEMYPNPESSPEAPLTVAYPRGVPNGAVQLGVTPVTIVTQVIVSTALGELPGQTECPYCQKTVITTTEYTPGLMSWLMCGSLSIIGVYAFCCCFLPLCIKACKDVRHRCPLCKQVVYTYKRM